MNPTNDLDTATGQRSFKDFATLAAQFALLGVGLVKADSPIDGQALYIAMHWSHGAKPLPDLEAARVYLGGLLGNGNGGE
ncbi:hypothetical protein LPB72_18645 [Hydrogenophaga crassostreae]|uniref:Uncharacterized protein n=1 Tax=Hydrogenophaga crassostreae TaxID=1763535 RepID=A0A163C8X2_9BURK|nr:hypothetical protein [Hydrogenophaga crassostreae]AOW12990.1 hypothetical protein LPB072_09150 [Hydrogenophaga crassostreae]OAD40171.1 hypothetical protein LPB72_18645 [Hydrogenophaga crassostreae]